MDLENLRTWAAIDLDALRHNARICRKASMAVMAVIKADAYGHGKERIATTLAEEVDWFGVANVAEAEAIRGTGVETPILILGPILPSERKRVATGGFSAALSNLEEVAAFDQIGARVPVHAVADTGMGRMGALEKDFPELVAAISSAKNLTLEGIFSHFPVADEDEGYTRDQIARFSALIKDLQVPIIHLGNSAGLLGFGAELEALTTLIRPGLAIYGVSPLAEACAELRPVMSLMSRITLIRNLPAGRSINYGRTFVTQQPSRVATIGIGYGDGYPYALSGNGAEVWIANERFPVLGRITMDQIVVDVSGRDDFQIGDPVELFGHHISVTEIAEKAGAISWEILTGITNRVIRVYSEK